MIATEMSQAEAMIRSQLGQKALLCSALFVSLELGIYLYAFAYPQAETGWLQWEGPTSLILLALSSLYILLLAQEKLSSKLWRSVLLLSALPIALALLPVLPQSQTPYRVVVRKSERSLTVLKDGLQLDTYTIALGASPKGHKTRMGDGKTPLGRFRIVDKGPSPFHNWLGLNYPNLEQAWEGRRESKLTWLEYWYLRVENLNGRIPYSNSPLGGAIGIHGGGSKKDWTLGCIALENSDLDEFYSSLPLGTEVLVLP